MAMGELLATTLGAEFLSSQGIDALWLDARGVLHADERLNVTQKASLLSATCDFAPDAALQAKLGDSLDRRAHHPGLHRMRTQRAKPFCWAAAAPGYIGRIFCRQIERRSPGDLD